MLRDMSHRVRQFFGALRPRVSDRERFVAYLYLTPELQRLFETMTLRDQQHGIIVATRVGATAGNDMPLLIAALLHDCGKGPGVRLWHRVAHVLLGVAPALEARIAQETGGGWRNALWRLHHHPEIGARLAAASGADPDVVRMIREQDAAEPDVRLAILQAADNA
jgi:hypothetical protein